MNKKGFTLIELLAVIIILGILMIIAIPSVTRYISDSRKSSYVDTAKELASAAKNLVNEGKLGMYDTNTTYYIPFSCIKTENGAQSPYGEFEEAFVLVTFDGRGYKYYWVSRDDAGQGVKEPVAIDKLNEDNIESDIGEGTIKTTTTKDGTSTVKILKNDCKTFKDNTAAATISDKEGIVNVAGADRYVGRNPDNYVYFNNNELWRIIGVYDGKLKIIRTDSLGNRQLNFLLNPAWASSDLQNYLSNTYYPTIAQASRDMVEENSTWYVGHTNNSYTAEQSYNSETQMTWVGKIGLMSLYEYLYAASESCYTTIGDSYFISCKSNDWLWLSSTYDAWTMGHYSTSQGIFITNGGRAFGNPAWCEYGVFPAVYLKSSVKITGGKGTKTEPYILGL